MVLAGGFGEAKASNPTCRAYINIKLQQADNERERHVQVPRPGFQTTMRAQRHPEGFQFPSRCVSASHVGARGLLIDDLAASASAVNFTDQDPVQAERDVGLQEMAWRGEE